MYFPFTCMIGLIILICMMPLIIGWSKYIQYQIGKIRKTKLSSKTILIIIGKAGIIVILLCATGYAAFHIIAEVLYDKILLEPALNGLPAYNPHATPKLPLYDLALNIAWENGFPATPISTQPEFIDHQNPMQGREINQELLNEIGCPSSTMKCNT